MTPVCCRSLDGGSGCVLAVVVAENAFYNFVGLFHTLGIFFIPWAFSYLEYLFHTLGIFFIPLVFFHTIDARRLKSQVSL